MNSQPIDFRHTLVAKHPERLSQIRYLLADSGLGLDNDITLFVEAWSGSQLVGCAGLAANVIKCVAVNEQLRGENLSARLLAEVENAALERGHFHLFLCTRPCNRERFARSGFWPIAQSGNNAVLMENTPQGIRTLLPFPAREAQKRGEHWRDSDERQSLHPRPSPSGGAGGAAVRCAASLRGA